MFVHVQHGVWEYSGTIQGAGSFPSKVQIKNQGKPYDPNFTELCEVQDILLDAFHGRIYHGMTVSRSE